MATTTTNYGLTKPEYSDTADIEDINGNMDAVDTALDGLGNAVAAIADGDTHAAIAEGGYIYVRNHDTLAEGLYTANSAIAEDGELTSSNVTAAGDLANIVKGLAGNLGAFKFDRIFYGTKTTSGNITLTKDYTDYDFLILVSMTNSEYFTDVFPVAFKTYNDTIACSHSGTPVNGGFTYNSVIKYKLPSNTKRITISNEYNNSNWQLGVLAVYGLKIYSA